VGSVDRVETLKERRRKVRASMGVSREMYICRPLKREFEGEEVDIVGCGRFVSGSAEVKMSKESSSRAGIITVSVESVCGSLAREAILEAREASCFVVSLTGRVSVGGCSACTCSDAD
jgi:hypothetical protein